MKIMLALGAAVAAVVLAYLNGYGDGWFANKNRFHSS